MPSPLPPPYRVTTPWGVPGPWMAGRHTGEDYSTHGLRGVPVLATRRGRVVGTGNVWGSSYGLTVVIEGPRGRIRMGYCHLRDLSVSVGDQVAQGHLIGFTGNSGRSTGPHLHYEERRRPFRYGDDRKPRFSRSEA
jgi:murein DD-endopeptidase MepM/ murein hydrolase activator NlpD